LEVLANLEHLDLASCPVIDLAPLGGCIKLKFLNLQATQAVGLSSLRPCGFLEVLDCSRTPLRFLDGLLGMASLHTLRLTDTRVADLTPLRRCFDLRTVDLSRTPALLQHVRTVLIPNCPRLKSLTAGPESSDVLKLLNEEEALQRRTAQAYFLRTIVLLCRFQRKFRAKLEARRLAFEAAVAEATRRARALGNVDAEGNVILPPELSGGWQIGGGGGGHGDDMSSDSDDDDDDRSFSGSSGEWSEED
jgi:hypothetical protein